MKNYIKTHKNDVVNLSLLLLLFLYPKPESIDNKNEGEMSTINSNNKGNELYQINSIYKVPFLINDSIKSYTKIFSLIMNSNPR
jgi:hypothetical protein